MRCLECNRQVRNNFKSRWLHMQRYHLDIFIRTLAGVLFNEEKLFLLGQYFGKVVRNKAYGAIGKINKRDSVSSR